MRSLMVALLAGILVLSAVMTSQAENTEQDLINKFLKRTEEKHSSHLSWMSGSFSMNRINRDNDYNSFADFESTNFTNTDLNWLGEAKILGVDAGVIFMEKLSLSVGGEYWLKLGESQTGSFQYSPPGGPAITIDDLKTEVQVWGVSTGVSYYFFNKPTTANGLLKPALRVGGTVGLYQATWEVWDEYQNLNLSTALPEGQNIEYKSTAPGFGFNLGLDYPLKWHGIALGMQFGYEYLNFNDIAWYNASDEEIVASYDGTQQGRVELDLSGFKGKIEIKRFFNW